MTFYVNHLPIISHEISRCFKILAVLLDNQFALCQQKQKCLSRYTHVVRLATYPVCRSPCSKDRIWTDRIWISLSGFHLKWAEQKMHIFVQAVAAKTPDKSREKKIHKMHVYGTCISQKTKFKSMLIKICICFCVCDTVCALSA